MRSRLDEAARLLARASSDKGASQRRLALEAIRHLLAWVSGRKLMPGSDFASDGAADSDAVCQKCFSRIKYGTRVDYDLCAKCREEVDAQVIGEENDRVREKAVLSHQDRVQAEIRRLGDMGVFGRTPYRKMGGKIRKNGALSDERDGWVEVPK